MGKLIVLRSRFTKDVFIQVYLNKYYIEISEIILLELNTNHTLTVN